MIPLVRLVAAALILGACSSAGIRPAPSPAPVLDLRAADTLDPQPGWSYEDLRSGALHALAPLMGYDGRDRPPPSTIQALRILAWHVTEDTSREMRVERALLWLRLSGDPPLWALANLYRQPLSDSTWRPATATHTQYFGGRLLVNPPANTDIYALLDISDNWRFTEDPAAPFVAADVRERTWTALVGEPPERDYGGQAAEAVDLPDRGDERPY